MNNNMEIIELENGLRLIIVDEIDFQNKKYVRVAKFNNDGNDILEDTYVYEKDDNNLVEITDNYLLEMILNIFESRK
ncbi:MAG: hypothetical protein E7158_03350 [Firmicutes bacterium]|nr:hypothetical protein [Bacillota bacterium]